MVRSFIEWIAESLLFIFFGSKIVEVCLSLAWVIRHGEKYAVDLTTVRKKWRASATIDVAAFHDLSRKHARPVQLTEWPLAKHLLRLPQQLQRPVVDLGYRLPSLVLVQALALCLLSEPLLLAIGSVFILAALWLETAHILGNRLILGHLDHALWRTLTSRLWPYGAIEREELFPDRRRVVREFVTLFGWLLMMTIASYTSVYYALVTGTAVGATLPFVGIRTSPEGLADALYFTIITLATVGYGDVYPAATATFARLLVASEVIVGFALIVILLASFSMTVDEPDEQEAQRSSRPLDR